MGHFACGIPKNERGRSIELNDARAIELAEGSIVSLEACAPGRIAGNVKWEKKFKGMESFALGRRASIITADAARCCVYRDVSGE